MESREPLSSRQRWLLAWAIAWPSVIADLISRLILGALRTYLLVHPRQAELIDSVYQLLFILFVIPWIVRRAVRLNFPDFHLAVVRKPTLTETRAMTYRESLSVTWLITWRAGAISALLLGMALLVMWIVGGTAPAGFRPPANPFGVSGLVMWFCSQLSFLLLLYFWLIQAAIRHTYSDFALWLWEKKLGDTADAQSQA